MEYLIILSAIIIIIGYIIGNKKKSYFNELDFWCKVIGYLFFIGLVLSSIGIYYDINSKIPQFKSVQLTLDNSRKNEIENYSNFELATFQLEVAEQNKWLAETKYWNNTWVLDVCIPDEIDKLEPIN